MNALTTSEPATASDKQGTQTNGLLIGWVVAIDSHGMPLVAWNEETKQSPQPALATIPVSEQDRGRQIALSFAQNANSQPIIIGFLFSQLDNAIAYTQTSSPEIDITSPSPTKVRVNDKNLDIQADKSITIRCGKARITLTADGKILLQGEQVLSRARGAHRIRGGSIQLN
ncbi:DUF6484 domain-containing protein [Hahella aquimaris]|uniref:DUF6484 domain-containing protein n=1 Tax=Hahella sp. HNIBRBA332 TaxID=3015983 RepID=UPI00273A84A1|nr:DUF6484 domain-containing protein [Hahella sp. HNIBRBA332]WLQ14330.1 DUF6484 domain-containing protein [Hahella sp. HNIBRBA332]